MKNIMKILFAIQVILLAVFLLSGSESIAYENVSIYYNPKYTLIYLKDILNHDVAYLSNVATVLSVMCAFISMVCLIIYDNVRNRKKVHIYKIFGHSDVAVSLKNSFNLLKWFLIPSIICLIIDVLLFKIFTDFKILNIIIVAVTMLSVVSFVYFSVCYISTYFITKYNTIKILKGSATAKIIYGLRYVFQYIGIVLSFVVALLFMEIKEDVLFVNFNEKVMLIYKTGLSLTVSILSSLIVMGVVLITYYNKNKYKIVIKNIYGYSVFEKYKRLIVALILILTIAVSPFYLLGYNVKYLLFLSLYYLLFEFIFIYIVHNKLEKQHINRVLKGE